METFEPKGSEPKNLEQTDPEPEKPANTHETLEPDSLDYDGIGQLYYWE